MIAILGKMCFKIPTSSIKCQFIIIVTLSFASYLSLYVYNETIFSKTKLIKTYHKILEGGVDFFSLDETRKVKMNFPNQISSQYWQQAGVTNDLYVYSAYYKEDENIVQIIGIALLKTKVTCTCIFHSYDSMDQNEVDGKLELHPEHHFKPTNQSEVDGKLELLPEDHVYPNCTAVFIRCPVKNISKPATVGIMVENVTTYLRVIYASPRRYNFTVCISCLHGPYKDVFSIIEMVEADMIFGAEFFIVYNYSTSPEVDQVLRHYEKRGIMKIIQWNSPNVDVWYFGQLAALQDCTFASRHQTKYLVLKDIDELIVPRIHKNWHELMRELDKEDSKNASYTFLHSFFHLNWKHSIEGFKQGAVAQMLKLKSLLYVQRDKAFYPPDMRTKVIVHPERIVTAGIHFPWKVVKGYKRFHSVDTKIAFLHHYRAWGGAEERVKDDFMRTFTDELIYNVNKTLSELGYRNISGSFRVLTQKSAAARL